MIFFINIFLTKIKFDFVNRNRTYELTLNKKQNFNYIIVKTK